MDGVWRMDEWIIDRCGLENGWMMDDVVWRTDGCGLEIG